MRLGKVIIVGGAGFAGQSLVRPLVEKGYEVKIIDIVAPDYVDNGVEYVWKSVHDIKPEDLDGDYVIDAAAQADVPLGFTSPLWTCWQNVYGTLSLLEAARHADIKKLVIMGSGCEYGVPEFLPITEEHPLTPANPYGWSKACQEMAGMTYWRCYGVPVVVVGNGCVVGAGMRKGVFVYKWLHALMNSQPVYLEGGNQTRDLAYITDVIDGLILVMEKGVIGEKYQISSGVETSVMDILDHCIRIVGKEHEVIVKPHRPGEIRQRERFDISKARGLGYAPKIDIDEGLRLTYEWVKGE